MTLARIPLRARLALAYAGATAIVLILLGGFLHARLRADLDNTVRGALRQRAGDLVALVGRTPGELGRSHLVEPGDDPAQVLSRSGAVLAGAPGFDRRPLLTPAELRRGRRHTITVARRSRPSGDGEVTLLATPAHGRVVVVGTTLEERDDALSSLDHVLILGIPLALALASLAGFLVAGRALAPVERLRRRADEVSATDLSERLPVPPADDEVRHLAQTLNAMLGRLQEGFARERAFVADASHELRMPLAALQAELELAARPGRSAGELGDAVTSAGEEAQRLARLAEDLLVIARADQGRLPIVREELRIRDVLDTVRRRVPAPPGRSMRVQVEDGLVVHADRVRLEQALGNLVDNALRHGAGDVVVTAAPASDGGGVVVRIRDAGTGFPPGFAAQAFARFTRGDEARERGGTGLGLAIVAAIVASHGGQVGIDPSPHGADVWLRLPG